MERLRICVDSSEHMRSLPESHEINIRFYTGIGSENNLAETLNPLLLTPCKTVCFVGTDLDPNRLTERFFKMLPRMQRVEKIS